MILLYVTKETQECDLIKLYMFPHDEVNIARLALSQSAEHLTIAFIK